MTENNVNGIIGADVATTTGIVGATIAIGQYIVNDYVITITEAEGDYGYTMTITKGTQTQTVTLYGLTPAQYDAMLGYLEQAQAAAQSAQSAAESAGESETAAREFERVAGISASSASSAKTAAQSAASNARSAASDAASAKNDAVTAKNAAEAAAARAEDAAGQITGMTAEAETLEPGSSATASFLDGVLSLGIPAGANGANGNGIVSITKTGTEGNVDTYTITFTNGTTSTFTVTNGVDGAVTSVAGKTGAVILDAGDVSYDDQQTYDDGTVGAGLTNLKSQIEEISQSGIDASGASDGQVPVADGQGSWAWDDPAGSVSDVQVNGVSVVTDGVANVPIASNFEVAGVVKVNNYQGFKFNSDGSLAIDAPPSDYYIKQGIAGKALVVAVNQHRAVFYGLAKAAGSDEKNSTLPLGQYSDAAKSAISEMLGGSVAVTGTTPSITALPGVRYVCGEASTIDITVPATGIIDVVFTSGATPAVLTVIPPTGVTMKWANGFDPTTLEANTVYEINIMDGEYGVVGTWT